MKRAQARACRHGVARLRAYFMMLREGLLNPRPNVRIVSETASTATVDGDNGLGCAQPPVACLRRLVHALCLLLGRSSSAETLCWIMRDAIGLRGTMLAGLLSARRPIRSLSRRQRSPGQAGSRCGAPTTATKRRACAAT
jgi:hypothetical protein